MSDVLALLAAGAAPLAVALALVHALAPGPPDPATAALRGAAVALTALGVASLLAVGKALAGVPLTSGLAEVGVAALALVGAARVRRAGPAPAPVAPAPPDVLVRAARVALGLGAAAAAVATVHRGHRLPDGDWDAIAFWTLRARYLAAAPGDAAAVFPDGLTDTHPDYPLLLPGARAWVEAHVGRAAAVGTGLGLVELGALAAAVGGAVGALRRAPAGALAALAVLGMPRLLRLAPSSTADLPVAAAFAVAAGALALAAEAGDPRRARAALRLAGLGLGLAAWTKNEGCAMAVAGAATVLLVRPPALGRGGALAALAVGAAPFVAAYAVQHVAWAPPNDLVAGQGDDTLARLLDPARWDLLLRTIGRTLVAPKAWGVGFPVVIAALVVPARALPPRLRPPGGRGAATVALLGAGVLAAYALVYAVTPQPLAWHLRTSCERILAHVTPVLVLGAALRWAPARRR